VLFLLLLGKRLDVLSERELRECVPDWRLLKWYPLSWITLRLAVYLQSVRLGVKPLETHDHYFFQLSTCSFSPYVTSSLTRGWVCRLQLLLVLACTVILGSESHGTHYHISLSQRELFIFIYIVTCSTVAMQW
jgi:hypothetical protein